MANEVFFDTSGFFTVMDERDDLHQKAVEWLRSPRGEVRPVTTDLENSRVQRLGRS
jgi:predicted nucleic acid-binding protein